MKNFCCSCLTQLVLACLFLLHQSAVDALEFSASETTTVSPDQPHFAKEPDIILTTKNSVQMRIYPVQPPFDTAVSYYYVIVEYRRKGENRSYFTDRSNFHPETTFGRSTHLNLPYYAALRINADRFRNQESMLVTVGEHELEPDDDIDFNHYLNPYLICGYDYRFGLAAKLKSEVAEQLRKLYKYLPVSRSIILGSAGDCDTHEGLMILFVISIGLLVFVLMAVLAILVYTKLTTNESWGTLLRFWKKPALSSTLFGGQGRYTKDRLNLLNHISSYEDEDDSDDGPVNIENFKEIHIEPRHNPIRMDKLFSYFCEALISHRLKEEFLQIPKGQLRHWHTARLPINRGKHRYNSLMAYDFNRVVLKEFKGEHFATNEVANETETTFDLETHPLPSDYINASYVDGHLAKRRFIATQGPLVSTFGDFWKMIWQTNCVQIVMLTNVQEMGKIKCDKYWPELGETLAYGQLSCMLYEEQICADYTIRLLRLWHHDHPEDVREVIQYHFTAWPDHSVPVYSDAIPMLLHRVRSHPAFASLNYSSQHNDQQQHYAHPVVVHCSAGIGRTGTLILISNILDAVEKVKNDLDPKIDILKEFCAIRAQRINLIERISQYVFVHRILVEMLARKDLIDLRPEQFPPYFEQLRSPDSAREKCTRIDAQFKCLQRFRNEIEKDACSVGHFHIKRNRNKDVIPANNIRVVLPVLDNDYINALYVNGFRHKNEFIVTEVPLKECRGQFWLMMNSCDADTIVLLNSLESGDVYWPTELNCPLNFRELKIELMSEEKNADFFIKRQFRINGKKLVHQLHYSSWAAVSKRPTTVENFHLLLRATQQHLLSISQQPNQCVIQCLNGVTASGVFCTSLHLMERLESERKVNVFLSSKYVRTHRPHFIEDLEQYNFLYELTNLFVRSLDELV